MLGALRADAPRMRPIVLLASVMLSGCAAPILLAGLVVGAGLREGQPNTVPITPERDFFTSGRPVAVLELQCARVQPIRVSDTQFIVQGCDQRATYVLSQGPAGTQWARDGDIRSVPRPPRPIVEALGECDENEVAELTVAGVSRSAIQSACATAISN